MNATKTPNVEFDDALFGYLCEVRDRVCSLCGGRPVGDPRGNPCGTMLPLDQLAEALEDAEAWREHRPSRSAASSHPRACPLPMRRLAILAALAAEDVEERQGAARPTEILCKGDLS
jgi:hypothetical protein